MSRVSVVIPTYNRERFLADSVRSVLEQTVPVEEILIVDDGSTDDTPQLVRKLAGPIQYFRQANKGPAAARNRGIREARCELVALLDSDDLWLPGKLEHQLAVLDRRPEVGMVHTAAIQIDQDGCPTGPIWRNRGYDGRIHDRLLIANGVNASSALIRRHALLEVGGYDENFRCLENWDLWLRLSRRYELAYLDQPWIKYRVHGGNLIKNLEHQRENYARLLTKHLEAIDGPMAPGVRRRAYARFHQAFADALVTRGDYASAQIEFLKSLYYLPWQTGVAWRLFRVTSAMAFGSSRKGASPSGAPHL